MTRLEYFVVMFGFLLIYQTIFRRLGNRIATFKISNILTRIVIFVVLMVTSVFAISFIQSLDLKPLVKEVAIINFIALPIASVWFYKKQE